METTRLNDIQRNWLISLLNDNVWCDTNPSSERVVERVVSDSFYTEQDKGTFNQHIIPRYIEYRKLR